jgi:hypothetical protein
MKMQTEGFLTGIVIGFGICVLFLGLTDNVCTQGREAIDICEKSLPRNQKCKLYAKSEEITTDE